MRLFLRHFPALLQLLVLVCATLAGTGSVQPATLTVTSTADNGAGSLRDTIAAAGDGDTIQFDATLNGQTIGLTSGELVIDKNITINGPGPDLLTVRRGLSARPPATRAVAGSLAAAQTARAEKRSRNAARSTKRYVWPWRLLVCVMLALL